MRNLTTRHAAAFFFGVGLALAPWTAEAGARTGRGGGGGGGGATAPRTATRSTHAGASGAHASGARPAPRAASGKATYGHYSSGYYGGGYWGGYPGYGYGGYYPYYGYGYGWDYWPSWSVGVQIGWPYWGGGGYWGDPYAYGYPYAYPSPYGYAYEQGGPPAVPVGPASVEIDVTPRNTRVIWNGEDIGRAKDYDGRWDRLRIGAGRQVLELKADGYKTLRVVMDAGAGGSYRLNYTLEEGEGLDARSQDPAAMPPPQEARPAGTAIEGGEGDTAPSARLEKGFLRLTVTPPDAAVYLDGEYFARGDEVARLRGAIPLAVGTHRIEVVRPGFANETVEVNVDRGATTSAAVVLEAGK